MEIPDNLKELYRHWETHSAPRDHNKNLNLPEEIEYFINERMRVWEKKQLGENPLYTLDPILQSYRFCNIYRELDRQTIEIHTALKSFRDDFELWLLNMAFQRFVSRPETVEKVGFLSFDTTENAKVMASLENLPRPKYGNAYLFPVSIIQKSDYPTREAFFCLYLPKVIKEIASVIDTFDNTTVANALEKILPAFGFNFRFHWSEILIDVAYQSPDKIDLFKDFHVGPGAVPTAKSLNPDENPVETVNKLVGSSPKSFPHLEFNGKPVLLSAENWEGIFCEYRKYVNLKSGKGRSRKYA